MIEIITNVQIFYFIFQKQVRQMRSNLTTGNKLKCSLHSQPFSLYCDRCLQPVCQKCTYIGPHNTSLHSLVPFHQAYQRRVQQINTRLAKLAETRQMALHRITVLSADIEKEKVSCQQIEIENDKKRSQLEQQLVKKYENLRSIIMHEEQIIHRYLSTINDLGHQFQDLSVTSDIETLINYERIMSEFRQSIDQLEIVLDRTPTLQQLPKQLSQIRIKLKEIQTFEQLYKTKISVIKSLIKKLESSVKKIQTPKLDYKQMLTKINSILKRYHESSGQFSTNLQKPNLRKTHFVCHFCGVIMDDQSINQGCPKNQINQQIKTTQRYYLASTKIQLNKVGYCKKQPDIGFFGTHRHYFGEPASPSVFFRAAYLNCLLGNQVIQFLMSFLPQQDSAIQIVNQESKSRQNSFVKYLEILFIKIATICKIKQLNLEKIFKNEDIGEGKKIGYCQGVSMEYILLQKIGVQPEQNQIILQICSFQGPQVVQLKNRDKLKNYSHLIKKIAQLKI